LPYYLRVKTCGLVHVLLRYIQQCVVSEENPYPPHRRSSEIPRERGVLKAKILETKYEAKLEFLGGRGGGGKTKNLLWGLYGYFLELHNLLFREHEFDMRWQIMRQGNHHLGNHLISNECKLVIVL